MISSTAASKIRVGIVGLGGIATRMHIPALSSMEEVEIVAGADINLQQAERTQKRFGIPRIHGSYEELFEKERLDAVYICLPSFLHYEAAKAALERGMHVFCEKPMGLSAEQAQELVHRAEQNGLVLVPGYQLRFNGNYLRGKQLIEGRRLGKILQFHGLLVNPGPYAGWDPKSDWYYDERGHGVLYDLGCHLLDLLFFLWGPEITEVHARAATSLPGLTVPDCIAAVLSTNTHVLGSLNVGWSTGATFNMIQVHGTGGSLLVSSQYFEYIPPEAGGFHRLGTLWDNARRIVVSKVNNLVKKQLDSEGIAVSRDFIEAIVHEKHPLTSAKDAVRVLEILGAMKESVISGKPVGVQRQASML